MGADNRGRWEEEERARHRAELERVRATNDRLRAGLRIAARRLEEVGENGAAMSARMVLELCEESAT